MKEILPEVEAWREAGEKVVVSANFLIDAESNLKAALSSFSADQPAQSPAEQGMPSSGEKMK